MGRKRSPYLHQQAADPRPGCGQLATSRWRISWRGFGLPFVLLDLLLQLPDLTKRSLICWLQPLDLGGFISTGFQPL